MHVSAIRGCVGEATQLPLFACTSSARLSLATYLANGCFNLVWEKWGDIALISLSLSAWEKLDNSLSSECFTYKSLIVSLVWLCVLSLLLMKLLITQKNNSGKQI